MKPKKTKRRGAGAAPRKKKHVIRTSYLGSVYDVSRFRRTIRRTLTALRRLREKSRFEAIAFRGSSGAALAFVASAELGVPLLHVRKPRDDSHSGLAVEGATDAKSYVIVDDFVSSGETIREIVQRVEAHYERPSPRAPDKPELVAVVLYDCERSSACYTASTLERRLGRLVRVIGTGTERS